MSSFAKSTSSAGDPSSSLSILEPPPPATTTISSTAPNGRSYVVTLGAATSQTLSDPVERAVYTLSKHCLSCDQKFLFRTDDNRTAHPISFYTDGRHGRCGGAFHTQCAEIIGEKIWCSNADVRQFGKTGSLRSSKDLPDEGWACVVDYDVWKSIGFQGRPHCALIDPMVEQTEADGPPSEFFSNDSQRWINFTHEFHAANRKANRPSDIPAQQPKRWTELLQAWRDEQKSTAPA